MAGLTQARFAQLLVDAQTAFGMSNDRLAEVTGIDATTISRYRNPQYKSGPPSIVRRGLIERAVGLPTGYLSGDVTLSAGALRELATLAGHNGSPVGGSAVREAPGASHYASGQPARTVEQVRAQFMARIEECRARHEEMPLSEVFLWMDAALRARRSAAASE